MIKAVIFDLDDTLISEKEYVNSGFQAVSEEISYRYNLDCKYVVKIMNELFDISSKYVFNRLLEFFNIEYSNDEIIDLINIYRNHKPNIKFFDDVLPTINYLKIKRIKLGIITDGYKETQIRKVEALKCREIFDEIIITDELGREFWKPHKKAYEMMAEKLEVKYNEIIYVGDNEVKDFKGAKALGILTIKVERSNGIYKSIESEKEFQPQYKVKNIKEIKKVIDNYIREEVRNRNEENFIRNYS